MKMTDGLFHRVFNEIAANYPDIEHEHLIIDIGTALIATHPQRFDVIVTLNLYGDIISDVAAQITGSVGLAGSANIGNHMAMFEAIHGSAPDIAGKGIANPSGLLNGAIEMLIHINQPEVATNIENAWLRTIEDGIHTGDIYSRTYTKKKVGTQEFAQAVIERLGVKPLHFTPVDYKHGDHTKIKYYGIEHLAPSKKELVGIDIFIDNSSNISPAELAAKVQNLSAALELIVITSRGLKIWPDSRIEDPFLQQCCCRFQSAKDTNKLKSINHETILELLAQFNKLGFDVIKTENLYTFDGQLGFALAQGQ
jgi:isocitrate dehydrogenase